MFSRVHNNSAEASRAEKKLHMARKLPKGGDGYEVFSVRIKYELAEGLDRMPERSGRSRNELVGILLDFAVKNCVIEEGGSL